MPRQIHILFNLIALFIIAYIVVDSFYSLVGIELHKLSGPEVAMLSKVEKGGEKSSTAPEFNKIVERNIFGATEKIEQVPVEEKSEPIETLEETSLQLSLLGTVAGDSSSARAIILDKRQRSQDIYRVGDSVQEAELKQILRGKVILRHGGNDEILTMVEGDNKPDDEASSGRATRPAALRRSAARVRPARAEPAEISTPEEAEDVEEAEEETIAVGQAELQESMSDLNELMTQVRVRPYFRRGKPEGLIVSQIQQDSVFAKLGLFNGDIISSVNGREISSPEEAFQFYNNLKSGGEVSIEITRRGQKKILTYDIQ